MNCDPKFQALLANYDLQKLNVSQATIYGCWADSRLAYFNPGWSQFSRLNGGEPQISTDWTVGRPTIECVADVLKSFFTRNIERCLRESRPWEHLYECSSASTFRAFHMITFPLGKQDGYLVFNSLRFQHEMRRPSMAPREELYRSSAGILTQCCHCRRVRRANSPTTWDWVSEWVTNQPMDTSHGICDPCLGFHYHEWNPVSDEVRDSFRTFDG
jgi:hypothetical protein